ncbi:hypothetical protein H310_07677 [Aphanomyces invadans]|uniref:Uncharacterized protein n=1 Tax=Aphanomyces invadans TaxID=157072 RepID=A0A024U221_9STRA|nr:hypothetical protein H310_07677 [Aphanomyces invadans]ETW00304.1 hypothetical protein H310_07677 [Aphanomyces invadans]|eukprot:XP_008871329.1 hypothetical protein H310_07677 [Aphanomyces invadans]
MLKRTHRFMAWPGQTLLAVLNGTVAGRFDSLLLVICRTTRVCLPAIEERFPSHRNRHRQNCTTGGSTQRRIGNRGSNEISIAARTWGDMRVLRRRNCCSKGCRPARLFPPRSLPFQSPTMEGSRAADSNSVPASLQHGRGPTARARGDSR